MKTTSLSFFNAALGLGCICFGALALPAHGQVGAASSATSTGAASTSRRASTTETASNAKAPVLDKAQQAALAALNKKIQDTIEALAQDRAALEKEANKADSVHNKNVDKLTAELADLRSQVAAVTADPKKVKPFEFHGGPPWQFINELQQHFGLTWGDVLTIAVPNTEIRVPSMMMAQPDPGSVLALYNRLAQSNPALGTWYIEGELENPSVVMLSPGKGAEVATLSAASRAASLFKVKALPLGGIPKEKWHSLETDVATAADMANRYAMARGGEPPLHGEMRIQPDSRVAIVMGPPDYIGLVESVIAAYGQAPGEGQQETRIIRLQYARAGDLVDLVQTLSNANGRSDVTMDNRINALIVTTVPSHMTEVVDLISRLDIPVDQNDTKKPAAAAGADAKPAP